MLEGAFDYTATNPDASCLHDNINYDSDREWAWRDAPLLIQQVMANACCDVKFEEGWNAPGLMDTSEL